MAPTALDFECALVTGGAGGIGKSIAESFVKKGKKVLIAGRTESKLQDTVKEINAAGYYVLDTSDVKSIPAFIEKITKEHPELDCIVNNAGVQRPFQVFGPDYDFDLSKADQEIDTNIRGPLHLCIGLAKHLNEKKHPVIMNVSSVLGWCPFSLINPVYNGTKAWVHMFTVNLRTQLEQAKSPIKVIEIAPPAVETDLHRERKNPDDNKKSSGNKMALSMDEFMNEVEEQWSKNSDTITAGPGHKIVEAWNEAVGSKYDAMVKGQ